MVTDDPAPNQRTVTKSESTVHSMKSLSVIPQSHRGTWNSVVVVMVPPYSCLCAAVNADVTIRK